MIRFTKTGAAVVVGALLSLAPSAQAETVLDFEGIAPVGTNTNENNSVRSMHGFDVGIVHGHYVDAGSLPGSYASNGTDFLLHDNSGFLNLARTDGGTFSIASFDATEFLDSFSGSRTISVEGFLLGGGSISTSFTTAARAAGTEQFFQTFSFGAGWENLTFVRFQQAAGTAAYDNIRLDVAAAPVPLPAAAWAGMALFGVIGAKRLRRKGANA